MPVHVPHRKGAVAPKKCECPRDARGSTVHRRGCTDEYYAGCARGKHSISKMGTSTWVDGVRVERTFFRCQRCMRDFRRSGRLHVETKYRLHGSTRELVPARTLPAELPAGMTVHVVGFNVGAPL